MRSTKSHPYMPMTRIPLFIRRVAAVDFAFFLIKGLIWLAIFAGAAIVAL